MRLIKKVFNGICIVITLCCIVILVCALNPKATETLSALISGELFVQQDNEPGTENDGLSDEENKGEQNNIFIPPSVEVELPEQDYVAPSQDNLRLPEQVSGLTGLQLISGQENAIASQEAEHLQNSLKTGPTGEQNSFDTLLYPYYGMLDEDMQELYRQIYANALEGNESFAPVVEAKRDQLRRVFEAVYNDHPELFWLDTEYSCKYTQGGQCVEIVLKYNELAEDLEAAKERFTSRARMILSEAVKLDGLETKERYVHDQLLSGVIYQADASMGQSAYSALVNGKSVCAGYARAFQYLMQQLNVPCYYCTGFSGEDHAWNIIKLGKDFYNVDVTWDDTATATYDYYNKSDSAFAQTHVRTGLSIKLPACKSEVYDKGINNVIPDAEEGSGQNNIAGNQDSLSQYINDDPQKPLEWPLDPWSKEEAEALKKEKEKQENLDKAGITEEEVIPDLAAYYADCLKQVIKVGAGSQKFENVIPMSLWDTIESEYTDGSYKEGYVNKALEELKEENFAIQIQVEDLSGGYYRIYHNIAIWTEETEEDEDSKDDTESEDDDENQDDTESKDDDENQDDTESKDDDENKNESESKDDDEGKGESESEEDTENKNESQS